MELTGLQVDKLCHMKAKWYHFKKQRHNTSFKPGSIGFLTIREREKMLNDIFTLLV